MYLANCKFDDREIEGILINVITLSFKRGCEQAAFECNYTLVTQQSAWMVNIKVYCFVFYDILKFPLTPCRTDMQYSTLKTVNLNICDHKRAPVF